MRRPLNVGVLLAALALLLPSLALAQETTGGIAGTVVDPSNKPVSFATVAVRSGAGERQVMTDEQGRFLLAFLAPGTYTVVVSADTFGTLTDDGIAVGLGQRVSRRYVLQPVMEEALTVEAPEEAPPAIISNLATTTTGSNIPAEIAENIPMGRNISNVVFLTPNVKSGGGTGGANPSIGGSSGFENQYVFDGANVTNAGYGALGAFSNVYGSQGTGINYNFVKETQVLTNGFAAEFGQATGGIVNIVTKSGSNEWAGTVYANYTPTGLQGTFKAPHNLATPVTDTLSIERIDYGFDVGGPLIKDKLFFWLGANPGQTTRTERGDPSYALYADGPRSRTSENLNWAAKLSILPSPDHRIDLSAFGDPTTFKFGANRGGSLNSDTEQRFTEYESGYENYILNYHGTITPKLLAEATIGRAENTFTETIGPLGGAWAGTDLTPAQAGTGGSRPLGGIGFTEPESVSINDQFNFKFTSLIGDHEIKYGAGHDSITYDFTTDYTGPGIMSRGPDGYLGTGDRNGDGVDDAADDIPTTTGVIYQRRLECALLGDPNVRETVYVDDPLALAALGCPDNDGDTVPDPANVPVTYRVVRGQVTNNTRETSSDYTFAFIQDTWSTTPNVHVSFGVRWEKQKISGRDLSYQFPHTWSPRLGVSWDHTHQGKAKLYGFWGRFYEKVPLDMAVRALSQETSIIRGVYYDAAMSQIIPQGVPDNTFLRYRTTGFGTTEIIGGTKNSYTDGLTAGYERDLGRGWSLKAEWQFRKIGDVLEDFAEIPGSDIALGYAPFGHYVIGNIPPDVPVDTSNNPNGVSGAYYPAAKRDYQSLTVVGKHQSETWFMEAQYTLSNLHGNYEGLFRNDNGQSDPNLTSLWDFPDEPMFYNTFKSGTLNTNRTHRVQAFGYYKWANGWRVGSRFVGQSGTPRLKLASHPVYENGGEISLAPRGDLGDTPFEYNIDFDVAKSWNLPTSFESKVEVSATITNLFDRRYATNYNWNVDDGVELDVCTVDPLDPTCATMQMQYDRLVASVQNGVPDVDYGEPTSFSAPREVRFGVKWTF